MIPVLLIIAAAAGVGLIAAGLVLTVMTPVSSRWRSMQLHAAQMRHWRHLPAAVRDLTPRTGGPQRLEWLQRWARHATPRLAAWQFRRFSTEIVLTLVLVVAATAFMLGIQVLRNPLAGAALAAMLVLLPEQILSRVLEQRRRRVLETLPATAQALTADLEHCPNLFLVLRDAAEQRRFPEPIGAIMRQTVRDLQGAVDPDEAFGRLAQRLDSDHGRLFAQVLRAVQDDVSMSRFLPRIATRAGTRLLLARKNRVALASDRTMGLVLNALLLPAYLGVRAMVPDTTRYLTETMIGRVAVSLGALALVLGLVLDRTLQRMEV